MVGAPISVCTGNMYESAVDYRSAGSNTLEFVRSYNSIGQSSGALGVNWRHNFEQSFVPINVLQGNGKIVVRRPDGQELKFQGSSHIWTPVDKDVTYKLTETGAPSYNYILTDNNDTKEEYDYYGKLLSITYRSGYKQTLNYTSDKLTSVSDNQGRSLTFTYNADGTLATMMDPDGKVYTYSYTNKNPWPAYSGINVTMLSKVTYPSDGVSAAPSRTYLYENLATPTFLTGIVDELGKRYLSWTYDAASGQATMSEMAGGADRTEVSYPTANTRIVTFPLGEKVRYTFATVQNAPKLTLEERIDANGTALASRQFSYDSKGFLSSKTDWNGNKTTYVNNAQGLQTSRTEAFGTPLARTITTTWHPTFRLPTKIVEPRKTTDFTYDPATGNLLTRTETDTTTQTVPYSTAGQTRTWSYTYNSLGQVLTATGPRTDVIATTSFGYDAQGNLKTVTDALNHTTNITLYNNNGQPLALTDANGVVNHFAYDVLGRLLSRTVVGGSGKATTSFAYNDAGLLTAITLPDNTKLFYEYDDAHRLTAVENKAGERIEYALDAMGNVKEQKIKNSGGAIAKTQSRVFDEIGRLFKEIGAASQTTIYGYDANGNRTSTQNALNDTTFQAFDALNRMKTLTDPLSHATNYGYDAQDNLTSVTDPRALATSYIYDGFGQVIQETSPDRGVTVYTLDKAGNRTGETDARGVVTTRTFDKLDRVTTETYPASPAENVTYSYDATAGGNKGIGRLTGFSDESGSTALDYDERGNVVRDQRLIGGKTYTTQYAYTLTDQIRQIIYPTGHTVSYIYDALGRVKSVTAGKNSGALVAVASDITYKPFGPIATFKYGNGVKRTHSYDPDYRLTGITTLPGIQNLELAYNGVDNITAITDHLDAGRNQSFDYDANYRLKQGVGAYGTVNYTYDENGNRLTRTKGASTQTYSYPATSNKLATVTQAATTRALTYLANGNITTDDRGTAPDASFTYNNRNRAKTFAAGANTADYTYNALGERVAKSVQNQIAATATTHYHYDSAGHLLATTNGAGDAQLSFVWLGDMPLAQIDALGAISYIHPDHLNTPQKMTNAAKTIVWDRQQQPFGETHITAATATTPLRFPGQIADAESELNYNLMRDYDPSLGRYIQADPIGLGGSSTANMNIYGYANQNSLRYVDFYGLRPLTECEKSNLNPYIPQTDLDNADIHEDGTPWWVIDAALGFTSGNDIYFKPGVYNPLTPEGLALLGHELVHVGQYANGMTYLDYSFEYISTGEIGTGNKYELPAYTMGNKISKELTEKYGPGETCGCGGQ